MSFGDATAGWLQSIEDKHGSAAAWFVFICLFLIIPVSGVWFFFLIMDWIDGNETLVHVFIAHVRAVIDLVHRIY